MKLSNNNGKHQSAAEYLNENIEMVRREGIVEIQAHMSSDIGLTIGKSYLRCIIMSLLVAHRPKY